MPTMTSIKNKIEIERTPQGTGWQMTLKVVKYDSDGAIYVNGRPAHNMVGANGNIAMMLVAFDQHIEKQQEAESKRGHGI
jgi:hypothetical protein